MMTKMEESQDDQILCVYFFFKKTKFFYAISAYGGKVYHWWLPKSRVTILLMQTLCKFGTPCCRMTAPNGITIKRLTPGA